MMGGQRMNIPAEFLSAAINAFEANKRLADRAVEQVPDDKLHAARIHVGKHWKTLTIPRGGSEKFNKEHWGQIGKSHS